MSVPGGSGAREASPDARAARSVVTTRGRGRAAARAAENESKSLALLVLPLNLDQYRDYVALVI